MTAIIFRLGRPTSVLSSPGLTGRSSNHRAWILDCQSKSDASDFDHLISAEVGQARLRVKPGNDTGRVGTDKPRPVAEGPSAGPMINLSVIRQCPSIRKC